MTTSSLHEFRNIDAPDVGYIPVPPKPPKTTVLALTMGGVTTEPALCAVRYDQTLLAPGDPLYGEDPIFETHYTVLGSQRLPAGTGYPAVAARVNRMARTLYLRQSKGDYHVLVDASDAGVPVVDAIRLGIIPQVVVTAVTVKPGDAGDLFALWRRHSAMGLAYLISRARAVAQGGRLHLPEDESNLRDGLAGYDVELGGAPEVLALALAVSCESQSVRYLASPSTLPSARL